LRLDSVGLLIYDDMPFVRIHFWQTLVTFFGQIQQPPLATLRYPF